MGRMDTEQTQGNLIRAMLYGTPKSKKTWWSLLMAELGFNVILFDLDDGAGIAKNLSPAALSRIYRVDMRPNSMGYSTSGAAALSYAMNGQVIYFDEETREYVPAQRVAADREYLRIDLAAAGRHDLIVIDTWTTYVQQMIGNTVMIKSAIQIDKLEWDEYQKVRLLLDHFLGGLTKLNCHAIIVAHSETYAKKKPDANPKDAMRDQIDSVRLQPVSVTRAHGETMAGKFNEVLYFENHGATLGVRISTKGNADFDAGSRYFAPGDYKWADLTAEQMMSAGQLAEAYARRDAGAVFDSPALTTVSGAEVIEARKAVTEKPASVTVTDKPVVKSLIGLGKKA